jgi:hypothetical protein
LIETIELTPKDDEGLDALLYGDLADPDAMPSRIDAARAADPGQEKALVALGSRGLLSVVAGTGFEPVTFRL